jgi:hypothetical protein
LGIKLLNRFFRVPKYAYLDKTTNAFAVFKSDDDDTKAEVFLPIMVAMSKYSFCQIIFVFRQILSNFTADNYIYIQIYVVFSSISNKALFSS